MAKTNPPFTSIQSDLFQHLEAPLLDADNAPYLDINGELVGAVTRTIREARTHGLSRERIVERMNMCLDEDDHVTLRQLNAWTASSKEEHNFPARYLPAFCWAVGSNYPLQVLVQCLHYDLVDRRDQLAAELGNRLIETARGRREIKELQSLLGRIK